MTRGPTRDTDACRNAFVTRHAQQEEDVDGTPSVRFVVGNDELGYKKAILHTSEQNIAPAMSDK